MKIIKYPNKEIFLDLPSMYSVKKKGFAIINPQIRELDQICRCMETIEDILRHEKLEATITIEVHLGLKEKSKPEE